MKKIYFFTLIILSLFLHAQESPLTPKKILQVNTYNGGRVVETMFDSSGNHITVGFANGPYTFAENQIPTVGINDLYIIKNDKTTGEKVWLKTLNAGFKGKFEPLTATVDEDNNIFVVTFFQGELEINGQTYVASVQENQYKTLILKFNSEGSAVWGTEIDGLYGTSQIQTDSQNILFFDGYNKLSIYDKNAGTLISTRSFPTLRISATQIKNNQVFFSARTTSAATILNKPILDQNEIIVRTNLNFEEDAFIRLFPKNNPNTTASAVNISDILIDDNALYYTASYPSGIVVSAENQDGVKIDGTTYNNYAGTPHLWLGKFNFDLSQPAWFKGNPVFISSSSGGFSHLYKGRNSEVNVVLNRINASLFYGSQYKEFINRGMISVTKEGDLRFFTDNATDQKGTSYTKDVNFYYDNESDFTAYYGESNSKAKVFKKNISDIDFSNYKTYSAIGYYGYLRSRELFKVEENGDIYNSYITDGKIFNYFGQENEVAENNNIISKSSSNGNLQWKIKADGITDNYVDYWIEGHRIDLNANKEIVAAFSCYKEGAVGCKITDSQGNMQDFNFSTLISTFNNDGTFNWSKKLEYGLGMPGVASAKDFSTYYDNFGNVIVVGKASSNLYYNNEQFNIQSQSFFILTLDAEGNKLFFKAFPYSANSTLFAKFDGQNNIYLFLGIENQTANMQFDSIIIPQNGDNTFKFVLLKMNPQGTVLLGKNYLSNNFNYQEYTNTNVKFDGENFVLYGHTNTTVNLLNQPLVSPYSSSDGYFTSLISKINTAGEALWSYPFYSSYDSSLPAFGLSNLNSNNIGFDVDQNIYVIDSWRNSLNYRNNEITMKVGRNGLLFKLDADGNYKYHQYTDRAESNQAVSVYGKDKIALISNSSMNSVLGQDLNDLGGFNNYILFLEKEELATQEQLSRLFSIYPNPASDYLNIETKDKIRSYEIYDGSGRKMNISTNYQKQVDIRNLIKGVYYIRLITDKNTLTSKFIKN